MLGFPLCACGWQVGWCGISWGMDVIEVIYTCCLLKHFLSPVNRRGRKGKRRVSQSPVYFSAFLCAELCALCGSCILECLYKKEWVFDVRCLIAMGAEKRRNAKVLTAHPFSREGL